MYCLLYTVSIKKIILDIHTLTELMCIIYITLSVVSCSPKGRDTEYTLQPGTSDRDRLSFVSGEAVGDISTSYILRGTYTIMTVYKAFYLCAIYEYSIISMSV